jgi:glycosyltransferase involved in cell wall biosynthesis
MNALLMLAFHFPPLQGSSGLQRTLSFARYLPTHGWQPLVLTAHPRAYPQTSDDQLADIPTGCVVQRAWSWDTARHWAINGRYCSALALPDRWVSWVPAGCVVGWRMIRRYRPAVLWSSYPIASAHLLGLLLHRSSGIPWVADFRDSMTEADYPRDKRQWRVYRWLERQVVQHCQRAVFTTEGARRLYAERYPTVPAERWVVIANGYDERPFADHTEAAPAAHSGIRLLHSGILYPQERDPRAFFEALALLKQAGDLPPLQVILRATGHDDWHRQAIADYGLDGIVSLQPAIGYTAALAEMASVDGLLIFQASNCNHQIPAKLYEYLRAQRPILAFTDADGDTAQLMRQAGLSGIAALDNAAAIAKLLRQFFQQQHHGIASKAFIAAQSRAARSAELAALLNQVTAFKTE